LAGSLMIEATGIHQAVGADLGQGIVGAQGKVTNKTGETMHVSTADFTLISRKDGDRSDSLAPGELAGGSPLIVKRDHAGRGWAQHTNQPGFTGVGGMSKADKPVDEALVATLKSKELPDQETKSNGSVEGLLYFSMESAKLKLKDLALTYKGAGGRLSMEFK